MAEGSPSSMVSSPSSSASEGEYTVKEESNTPQFDFSNWNPDVKWSPEAPAGLQFISLLPIGQGYEVPYQQQEHVGKMKVSTSHRKTRRLEFTSGKTTGRNILDEKKLRQAIGTSDLPQVEELLQSGVDSCCQDEKKRTPLHFAAAKGNEQLVSVLLDYGADPNQKDSIGNTPLHLAACTSQIKVITLLLRAGTDVHSLDNSGRTPLHLARARLRIIHDDRNYTSDQLKREVSQVVDMMKEYLMRSGQGDNVGQLEQLCDQLSQTSTREEVDAINDLLSDFTSMTLQKTGRNQE